MSLVERAQRALEKQKKKNKKVVDGGKENKAPRKYPFLKDKGDAV